MGNEHENVGNRKARGRAGVGERLYLKASRDHSMPVNGATSSITIHSCPIERLYNRWETSVV